MHKKISGLLLISLSLILSAPSLLAQASAPAVGVHKVRRVPPPPKVCVDCIRAHENFLASDALQGRGSATHDELVAATYLASELEQYGVAPLGDDGGYLQRVALVRRKPVGAPQLTFSAAGQDVAWKHGTEMLVLRSGPAESSGPLEKVAAGATAQKGAFALLTLRAGASGEEDVQKAMAAGVAAVLLPETARYRSHWQEISATAIRRQAGVAEPGQRDDWRRNSDPHVE